MELARVGVKGDAELPGNVTELRESGGGRGGCREGERNESGEVRGGSTAELFGGRVWVLGSEVAESYGGGCGGPGERGC